MEDRIYRIANEESRLKKGEREYLIMRSEYFADASMAEDEDSFTLTVFADGFSSANALKNADIQDRYAFLIAACRLGKKAADYSFSLDPDNLVCDVTLAPRILLRMEPRPGSECFTDRYKALCGALIGSGFEYEDYLVGGRDLYENEPLLREIAAATSAADVRFIMVKRLEEQRQNSGNTGVKMSRKMFRTLLTLFVICAALAFTGGGLTLKYALADVPSLQESIALSDAFVAADYPQVIAAVERKGVDVLSPEEKYMAAFAAVKTAALSSQQKDQILSLLKVSSDGMLLDYWIYIGIMDYDKSLDLAKRIGKSDLEIYALIVMKEDAANDSSLSGSEKETKGRTIDEQLRALGENIEKAQNEATDEASDPADAAVTLQ